MRNFLANISDRFCSIDLIISMPSWQIASAATFNLWQYNGPRIKSLLVYSLSVLTRFAHTTKAMWMKHYDMLDDAAQKFEEGEPAGEYLWIKFLA